MILPSALRRASAATLALVLLSGCQKPETASEATRPKEAAGTVSAEKTSFDAVAKHLDAGGGLYLYLSTDQLIDQAAQIVGEIRAFAEAEANLSPEKKAEMEAVWGALGTLLNQSGLREIDGIGLSSIAVKPGNYRTRSVVHHPVEKGEGFLWKLNGGQSTALDLIDWLPEKTSAAGSMDLTLEPLWAALNEVARTHPGFGKGWEEMHRHVKAGSGLELPRFLAGLGPAWSYVITLDPAKPFTIPRSAPQGEPVTIPEPRLVISLQIRDEAILKLIQEKLDAVPNITAADEGDLHIRKINLPLPFPFLSPTIAWTKERLFIATNEELFREMLDVKAGKKPGLATTQAFKDAMEGLPSPASSFGYTTPEFQKAVFDLQYHSARAQKAQNPVGEMMLELLWKLQSKNVQAAVGQSLPEGLVTVSNGGPSPNQLVATTAVVPVAVLSGMAVPIMKKLQKRAGTPRGGAASSSKAAAVRHQLQLLDAAVDQWALEHNKAPGAQPTTDDLKPYLKPGTPLFALLEAHPGAVAVPLVPEADPVVIPPVDGKWALPAGTLEKLGPVPPGFWGSFAE